MEARCVILFHAAHIGCDPDAFRNQAGTTFFGHIMTPQFSSHHLSPIPLHLLRKTPSKPTAQKDTSTEEANNPEKKMYRCRACSNAVAHIGDEITVGDIPVDSMQINPHGYIHEIFTVRTAFQVIVTGQPVPADSWFPGYMWRFCLCAQCGHHLGWSYQPYQQETIVFFGLRRGSVKED